MIVPDHDEHDVWSEPDCSLSRPFKLGLGLLAAVLAVGIWFAIGRAW